MVKMKANIFIIHFLLLHSGMVMPSKILFLFPVATVSESNFYIPIMKELLKNGHSVTSVTSNPSKAVASNITEIVPFQNREIYEIFENPFKMVDDGEDLSIVFFDMDFLVNFCDRVFQNEEFQEKVLKQEFDLIITVAFVHQCYFGLASKFNASLIIANTLPTPNYLVAPLGNYFPPSYVPYPTLLYSNYMTFSQRIYNFLIDLTLQFLSEFSYNQKFEQVYRKYLPNGSDLPGVAEIRQNISLVLINSFYSLNYHRPTLPDFVEVGGLHCKPPKPLPTDIEQFVSQSPEKGFVYFSFGTVVQAKYLPKRITDMFCSVFKQLKLRVLWKWEGDVELLNCFSEEIKIYDWMPQQDILGHPNIKAFITHGGVFSIQETVYHGVPVLAFPFFFDQFTNVKQAVNLGFAVSLDIYNLNQDQLLEGVKEILTNQTYKERAMFMSKIFKDQQQTPLERAVYWIEYVLRHNGAPHLRSGARKLNWFQLHSLDVILCVSITAIVFTTTFILIFRQLLRMLFRCIFYRKTLVVKKTS